MGSGQGHRAGHRPGRGAGRVIDGPGRRAHGPRPAQRRTRPLRAGAARQQEHRPQVDWQPSSDASSESPTTACASLSAHTPLLGHRTPAQPGWRRSRQRHAAASIKSSESPVQSSASSATASAAPTASAYAVVRSRERRPAARAARAEPDPSRTCPSAQYAIETRSRSWNQP